MRVDHRPEVKGAPAIPDIDWAAGRECQSIRRQHTEAIVIDGIRLGPEAILETLEKMDAACDGPAFERRRDERVPYRRLGLLLHTFHPDVTLIVPSRDVSLSGFSFLYRNLLYPGTNCVAELIAPNGQTVKIRGKVVRCRHVHGIVHEVGVRFDRRLDEVCPDWVIPTSGLK